MEDNVNSTNNVNTAGNVNTVSSTINVAGTNKVNVVGRKISIELPFDPKMHALEDDSIFNFSSDDEDDGLMADMNNLDTTIQVSPIPTTRIYKNHPLDQVIKDLKLAPQTRKMSKNLEEHRFVVTIQQRTNHKDFQNCVFACFLSQEEPRRKRAIGSKWVFKNKKDKRGILIRNKARLVAQGYTKEEQIDYDEVFAHVARIEAIRLFLAYASFKDLVVYQMDVKGAFLYGKIEEEVYVCQQLGFEDLDFPDKVYKVKKALYGLHQAPRVKPKKDGIFISQDKYVAKILKNFGFIKVKTATTLMETQKPLLKDEDGEEVDVHMYRYFKYLKGQPKLGIWYSKDSLFDLVAYTNSDYVAASLNKKSTIRGKAKKRVRLMTEKQFGMELEFMLVTQS
uniref:Reverse transcriptase Ty1/copia-type domain-containing protein n=1 Tax=Tanacetum cinerariifolium TaxID=118510 RepID=A0A699GI62_TANCI|nr:hypothetical protein [Tanacetum cinerariifolium]